VDANRHAHTDGLSQPVPGLPERKVHRNDPSRVTELNLAASVQGGRGGLYERKGAGRFHLPEGKIANDTPAEDYPPEAYFTAAGNLIALTPQNQHGGFGSTPTREDDIERIATAQKDPELPDRYRKRFRHISLKIPANMLRKGVKRPGA